MSAPNPSSGAGSLDHPLRRVFGFSSFRPNQEEIVRALMGGRDVFAVMPTGGGKSLCYQLPAVLMPGAALVVSPLISLMKDQVDGARANGIRAAFLNSSLDFAEQSAVLRSLQSEELDLLYVAPERFALDHFRELLASCQISMAVIDEAHCISEWGHDFRPDYLALSSIPEVLPGIPVAAFTATATERVQHDIARKLRLRDPFVLRASFDRPNLTYEVRFKEAGEGQLVSILKEFTGRSGIVYRTSRKSVNDTAKMLQKRGFRALPYHAGLGDQERRDNQEAFIRDEVDVIVATVAFGMGIDKSNVRFVIHADLPKSIESYYQETGRAGRDGEAARCILLFSQADIPKVRFFIDAMTDEPERQRALDSLSKVISFASSTACRRRMLLDYFGETYPRDNCASCDVCLGLHELTDCTREAQMLLSVIVRTDSRFGAAHLIDILVGSKNQKIKDFGHDRLKVYGIGKEHDKKFWRRLIDDLISRKAVGRSEGLYPMLYLLEGGAKILRGEERVELVRITEKKSAATRKSAGLDALPPDAKQLFEQLRMLRKRLADEQGVPPYVVFSDKTLVELSLLKPTTRDEMLAVSGIGEVKLERYAEPFLRVIGEFVGG
ncbi:DNA helicase RecQ [Chlorobaculum thiosulfatiphilum]|uniref:DNA helicase RecQ n=1 Tax=Chlorobaculum thiosulfatiphilum TaxID=115852 RepID=A0A5C4S6S0_CHLTI|nr:DNA helicase RecQ [Chlorobaculum thiosulfatiphilum]TNJ39194.1 DNA helicase RecQ [Chlorobaculum thiosulfatiphilum]